MWRDADLSPGRVMLFSSVFGPPKILGAQAFPAGPSRSIVRSTRIVLMNIR
jgi:hypothetical protein